MLESGENNERDRGKFEPKTKSCHAAAKELKAVREYSVNQDSDWDVFPSTACASVVGFFRCLFLSPLLILLKLG